MHNFKVFGRPVGGGTLTATSPMHSKTGSVGYPLMGAVAAAFHVETDEELPYGERGEIRALSPMRMKGYYKNQAATDVFFHEDTQGRRWACTGDIGYVDEGGDVFICGRASDCYHDKNGHVAYCFDVEDVVSRHPAVFTCKLVEAMVEAKNAAVLHVVLKKDVAESPAAIISELAAACRKELPAEEMPEYYSLKNALPVHANGKCDVESLKKDIKELKHF